MNLCNLEKVWDYEVESWLIDSIPEITVYQKECITNDYLVKSAPFVFMRKPKPRGTNILFRLSIVPLLFVLLLLICTLPLKYILSGNWGYSYDKLRWFRKWCKVAGLK